MSPEQRAYKSRSSAADAQDMKHNNAFTGEAPTEAQARRAPVQGEGRGAGATPPGTIPWDVHVRVWEQYARWFGPGQSAEWIARRGGFGYREAQTLLAGRNLARGVWADAPPLEGWKPR